MSGHSKWSTIKRQKAVNDQARGKVFSKFAKAITIAVKTGGGDNPDANYKLRMVVEAAKAENMPKINIERAISKANSGTEQIEEILYEGFGPYGMGVLVEVATDNKNRTAQEIKGLFERGGGSMGGPGSVGFNFETKGELRVQKVADSDSQLLKLIDLGVEDVDDDGGELVAYVAPELTHALQLKVEQEGFVVLSASIIKKPKMLHELDQKQAEKAVEFLHKLEDNEDVQNVYTNADFSQLDGK